MPHSQKDGNNSTDHLGLFKFIPQELWAGTFTNQNLTVKDLFNLRAVSSQFKHLIDSVFTNPSSLNQLISQIPSEHAGIFIQKWIALYDEDFHAVMREVLEKNPNQVLLILDQLSPIDGIRFVRKFKNLCEKEVLDFFAATEKMHEENLQSFQQAMEEYKKKETDYNAAVQESERIKLANIKELKEKQKRNEELPVRFETNIIIPAKPIEPEAPKKTHPSNAMVTKIFCYMLSASDINVIAKLLPKKENENHAISLDDLIILLYSLKIVSNEFIFNIKKTVSIINDLNTYRSFEGAIKELQYSKKDKFMNLQGYNKFKAVNFVNIFMFGQRSKYDPLLGHDQTNEENILNFSGVSFERCVLARANFSRKIFVGANFKTSQLNLSDLSYADLSEADLTQASLSEVDLTGACLANAKLQDVNFSKAKLHSTVFLSSASFKNVKTLLRDLSVLLEQIKNNPDYILLENAIVRNYMKEIKKVSLINSKLAAELFGAVEDKKLFFQYQTEKHDNRNDEIKAEYEVCKESLKLKSQPGTFKKTTVTTISDPELRTHIAMLVHGEINRIDGLLENPTINNRNCLEKIVDIYRTLKAGLLGSTETVENQINFAKNQCSKFDDSFTKFSVKFMAALLKEEKEFNLQNNKHSQSK